ncbi:MAG TPA: sulfatase [Prolixibacteraceae bacterium]|nr:sulfatase [Prolixibacteraceae bacterium]
MLVKRNRNIVVLLCDQLRSDFLSVYGCKAFATPNIDKISKMGTVFDNAITQSTVCAPARACMMTGRLVSDHGVWTNDIPFREGLEYLPQRMNSLGYNTGAFGRLHHYPAKDSKGFTIVHQMEEGRLGEHEEYLQWLRGKHPEVKRIWNITNGAFNYPEEDYYEYWITSKVIDFINDNECSIDKKPFLAWVSFQGPHTPLDPPKEVKGSVDPTLLPKLITADEKQLAPVVRYRQAYGGTLGISEEEILESRKLYAETIVEIDRQVGRLLDHLASLGILENTTFIFSADHGDLLGDFHLQQKGPFPYHNQLSIPLIISNHPGVRCGVHSSSLAGNIDIPATVLDIAGSERGIGISRSLINLSAENPENPREVIFSEFCDSIKTVFDGRYKFSYYPFTGVSELYDIQEDPNEILDLTGQQKYGVIESQMLRHIIDFCIISKGVRIEAHDFVPEQQAGLYKKFPDHLDEFPAAHPLSNIKQLDSLRREGLSADYNEFCKSKKIIAHYGLYWDQ